VKDYVRTKQAAAELGMTVRMIRALARGPKAIIRPISTHVKPLLWHLPTVKAALEEAAKPKGGRR